MGEYKIKILHYFLGFPPYRTGGLTKFAVDLMETQALKNHVMALWPGKIQKIGKAPIIKKRKSVKGIDNYELINPLPVPLDEGIFNITEFTRKCDKKIYKEFLSLNRPDVIHIHSLMGLHRECIEAARELRIRTVYTSHDYFGICPKVTLYRYGSCCDDDNNCKDCIQCNTGALSLKKIQVLQSPLYRAVKNAPVVKNLRKAHRDDFFAEETIPSMPDVDIQNLSYKYRLLRKYYVGMYENIDFIHFNSTVAENIFKRYITPKDSRVIPVTNKEIKDNRNNIHIKDKKLRILCLAPAKPFKGFNVLRKALDELWEEGERNFQLRIFSSIPKPLPYAVVEEKGYSYSELPKIFSNGDVLVAPGIWYETFGFTVAEAISYGVPVIVSHHTGAKDIVGDWGKIVKAGDVEELKNAIKEFLNSTDNKYKSNIMKREKLMLWDEFVEKIYQIYGNKG